MQLARVGQRIQNVQVLQLAGIKRNLHGLCHNKEIWGAKCVKNTTNAIFVYLPLIYKCDTDLAKYLPELCISTSDLY